MEQPFDRSQPIARRRFKAIPIRTLVPNLITLLALCAGLTAIRMAVEAKLEWALAAIVFAALLDGIDGRVARMLKGTSRFGAELDSLADFVNFGVAPALILYFWGLQDLGLARFNVMIEDPNRPSWAGNFFVGVPAPAGAIVVLLPLYLFFIGMPKSIIITWITLVYTLGVAFLMVSRMPVLSGKQFGSRVAPDKLVPIFLVVILLIALLIAYPWPVLTAGTLAYLASLPFGLRSYRRHERGSSKAQPTPSAVTPEQAGTTAPASPNVNASEQPDGERPARLN
jgi:CDP-diacylglycerol--serine O-phosphatidyltransferase